MHEQHGGFFSHGPQVNGGSGPMLVNGFQREELELVPTSKKIKVIP
ncbi:hypothetical protein [Paenibacillus silagei]|nr:hypothetical protein [Paenibacillus silagei]